MKLKKLLKVIHVESEKSQEEIQRNLEKLKKKRKILLDGMYLILKKKKEEEEEEEEEEIEEWECNELKEISTVLPSSSSSSSSSSSTSSFPSSSTSSSSAAAVAARYEEASNNILNKQQGLCTHGKRYIKCRQCRDDAGGIHADDVFFCIHGKRRDRCKQDGCGGKAFCSHGIYMYTNMHTNIYIHIYIYIYIYMYLYIQLIYIHREEENRLSTMRGITSLHTRES